MVTTGPMFIGLLLGLAAAIVWFEQRMSWKFFTYVPGFVLLYIGAALLNTFGIFGHSKQISDTGDQVQDLLLPAMIFVFLFKCDLRKIAKLGPKLLITFFATTVSMIIAFTAIVFAFKGILPADSWKAFSALAGSWTGGSANMVAIQGILHAPKSLFGYVLIIDTIVYSLWLLIVFSSVGLSDKFNRWTKANTSSLKQTDSGGDDSKRDIDLGSLMALFGFAIFISAVTSRLGHLLPDIGIVINSTTWTILMVSVLGLIVALTPMGKAAGSTEVALVMLYMIIGIIASGSDFTSLVQAPSFLLVGACIVVTHGVLMLLYAKLTKTDLFSIAVASTAHIGGVASAPVVAGAFSRQLVPVGVLFALIGAALGTVDGLLVAQILGSA